MKTPPPIARRAVALCALLLPAVLLGDGADDFNDNSKDSSKWGADVVTGNGKLTETGQSLRYSCNNGTTLDNVDRPWNATRFPYNADWEVQIDCHNSSSPVAPLQVSSMGFTLQSPLSGNTHLYHELYNSALGVGGTERVGFDTRMHIGGVITGGEDSGELPINTGSIRLRWNSTTHVLTAEYDDNPFNGYQWTYLTTYGLSGAGGTYNANWGMADTDQFFLSVYGYSIGMTVPSGQIAVDNFSETGGVLSSGGTMPEPTGSFPFVFPTGNPLLTRIASLTGNYTGVTPTASQRSYDIDLAQDETGKIVALGTVDGIESPGGDPEVGGSVGVVKTVNDEPTAQLKGSFTGTKDGDATTASATTTTPLEIVDIGGGVEGGMATASYKAKVAGVPFAGKNVPFLVEAPPEAEANLKQDWSLQLDLVAKTENGKERIYASAVLTLPNGDTIVFAEKAVKFSATAGYKLTFKKGTNTTANPDVIDAKTTILLTGLKFVKVGEDWEPDAGTITYQFLGQKGVENLMEFVAP